MQSIINLKLVNTAYYINGLIILVSLYSNIFFVLLLLNFYNINTTIFYTIIINISTFRNNSKFANFRFFNIFWIMTLALVTRLRCFNFTRQ